MPFIPSTDMCIGFLCARMFLLECPEALPVRELKSEDRIQISTFGSIKLPFQMAIVEASRGIAQ